MKQVEVQKRYKRINIQDDRGRVKSSCVHDCRNSAAAIARNGKPRFQEGLTGDFTNLHEKLYQLQSAGLVNGWSKYEVGLLPSDVGFPVSEKREL